MSIHHDPERDLARLVDFPGGDPPEVEVRIKTNCAMFVCGIWRELGCLNELLYHQYVSGEALTWVLEIAREADALHVHRSDGPRPQRGDVLHWATPPKPGVKPVYNDHVAFLTIDPDEHRMVQRAGGGAADNLITETTVLENYTVDHQRPLRHWIDTQKVLG